MKKFLIYFIFIANFLAILFFWWHASGAYFRLGISGAAIALGRVFGLLAVYFVLSQFVFIGRSVWIEKTFGLDKLSRIHHVNGFLSIFFILLHPIFLVVGYAMSAHVGFFPQLTDFLINYEDVFKGLVAVILFVGIVFFSLYIVRKRMKYETWYYVHLGTYVAVLLAWGHQLSVGEDFGHSSAFTFYWYALYAAVFGNFLFSRFLKPLWLFYEHRFFVSRVERENDLVTSLYISGKHMERFRIIPGQFMMLRFLSKKYIWQAHPFSLSWVPKKGELRVTIKNVGDFTSHVNKISPGTPILIDGPYGIFTEEALKTKRCLFIAGGIGITPIRAIIESIDGTHDSVLIYGNRNENHTVFEKELNAFSVAHKVSVHYVMSHDPNFMGEKGKVTAELVERLVPDFRERDIFMCGPKAMMSVLERDFSMKSVPRAQVHSERFSL